jgi:hypothetical protein
VSFSLRCCVWNIGWLIVCNLEHTLATGTSSTALLNAYFERAGGYVYVVGIVGIFLFVQAFFVGTELWLSFWTKEQYGDRGMLFRESGASLSIFSDETSILNVPLL